MYFQVVSYQKIIKHLLLSRVHSHNFPKDVIFPFPESYPLIVCNIKSVELSADCILYNSVQAVNESKDFDTNCYWCFAGSGQGDRWLMDLHGMMYFYDHDLDQGFQCMEISFEQWLEMAHLIKQLEDYLDKGNELGDCNEEFLSLLNTIEIDLSRNYPYSF